VGGQLTLVRDSDAIGGRHDFVLDSIVPGPNVFVNDTSDNAYDESGPHHRWSTGTLFDNVVVHATTESGHPSAGSLVAYNRGKDSAGSLQGWAGANMVFWNSTGKFLRLEQPPTAQNWAIGCTGDYTVGDGFFESLGTPVDPQSLYYAQLQDRLSQSGPSGGGMRPQQSTPSLPDAEGLLGQMVEGLASRQGRTYFGAGSPDHSATAITGSERTDRAAEKQDLNGKPLAAVAQLILNSVRQPDAVSWVDQIFAREGGEDLFGRNLEPIVND
jgi:hypothetical protein